ncbi:MAG TPA: helix-turn-helix transcriptional regulator [Chloroflexia bacterium]|nr:helix-turn-helix transcriptional regulator [Chloroflexia bacterium]
MSQASFGKYIRTRREAMGLKRPAFEARYGIASGSLNNLEGGFSTPSTAMLRRLGEALGVRPGLLMDLLVDVATLEDALVVGEVGENLALVEGRLMLGLPDALRDDAEAIKRVENFAHFEAAQRQAARQARNEAVHAEVARMQEAEAKGSGANKGEERAG